MINCINAKEGLLVEEKLCGGDRGAFHTVNNVEQRYENYVFLRSFFPPFAPTSDMCSI